MSCPFPGMDPYIEVMGLWEGFHPFLVANCAHYRALVARAERRPDAEVYTWTIRHPLPKLPIPLRAPDADVLLPLGEAFEQTYRLGRFDRLVRHGTALPEGTRLSPDDRQWAESLGTSAVT